MDWVCTNGLTISGQRFFLFFFSRIMITGDDDEDDVDDHGECKRWHLVLIAKKIV